MQAGQVRSGLRWFGSFLSPAPGRLREVGPTVRAALRPRLRPVTLSGMKYGVGLIALLLGIGLLLYLQADTGKKVIEQARPARETAERVAGVGMRGSFKVEPAEENGRLVGLDLVELDPQSPLAAMYELKVGDRILEVGPLSARSTDADMLTAQLMESGARRHTLVVQRGDQRLELAYRDVPAPRGPRTPGGNLNPLSLP